ncbi:hypothetical protein L2744_21095 [Shewanella profunda]|uniref:hypothetical protein n=1 Tax=Shewanella profunda TaxID=254793 RepID=UPI00200CE40D|nr:hypothetical protein [Shewanella profunda]MCL1092048.1 hypothetical protein [Shewanella profunda]
MKHILFLVIVILSFSAFSDEFNKGENLITPYEMDSDKWDILQKADGSFRSIIWRSKEKGMADAYVVRVHEGNKSTLNKVRETLDAPGQKKCQSFKSIDLEPIPNKNYESLMWRTECTNGTNFKAQTLQLTIKGNDSNYLIQKIWRGEVSDDEIYNWLETLKKVYVCDTREKDKQCPSGYKKVTSL